MTVTMNFTPIHRFIPRKQTNKYLGTAAGNGKYISEWGPERFIALNIHNCDNVQGHRHRICRHLIWKPRSPLYKHPPHVMLFL